MNHHRSHAHGGHPAYDQAGATAYTTVGNSVMKVRRALPQRLLGVWAHPDDEAYLSAGLMARVVDAGGTVTVVTATKGEKGTDDTRWYDTDEFGVLRADELTGSLGELGVTDLRFLGLRDGECDVARHDIVIDAIAQVIEDVVPDAIVTFGPDGITNHVDHRAVSVWATEAWRRAGHGELLYAAMSHDYIARYRDLHDEIGAFAEFPGGRPISVGRARITLECELDEQELDRKRRALAAHGSQTAGLAELMGESTYRAWWRDEHFRAPTRSEIARCDLLGQQQRSDQHRDDLVGAAT